MVAIKQPLTNVQLEILKTFSHQLTDNEIVEFRKTLALFFAKRATKQANQAWEDNKWTDGDVDRMLNTKMRKNTN